MDGKLGFVRSYVWCMVGKYRRVKSPSFSLLKINKNIMNIKMKLQHSFLAWVCLITISTYLLWGGGLNGLNEITTTHTQQTRGIYGIYG